MVYTHALVTRPRPLLDELAGWLESTGMKPVAMPAFDFASTDEVIAADDDWRAAGSRLLLFTSPRAVHFGLPALAGPMLWGSRIASIGPATTRSLSDAGLACVQAPGPAFDSEALLEHLAHSLEPGAAVILTAPGGRGALQPGLEALGWRVRLVPVYRRVPLDPTSEAIAKLEKADRVLSVWTSGQALEHLYARVPEKVQRRLRHGTAIVVSDRLAEVARGLGLRDVRVAEGPSNGDILKCFHGLGG